MSYASERENIESHFKAFWVTDGGTPLTPAGYDGHAFTAPVPRSPWVRLTILSGGALQASVGSPGSNVKRHAGVVAIQINTEIGKGSAKARELADVIETIFTNVTIENLRFMIPFSTGAAEEVDGWSSWTIWCPFTRDEFNA